MINGKHGQTHSTKLGADKSAENTPNAPRFICLNCLPKPISLEFLWKKAALGVRSPCLEVWNETNSRSELFTVKLFVVACICTYVSSCIRVETDETRYVNAQYFLINDQPGINIFPVIFFLRQCKVITNIKAHCYYLLFESKNLLNIGRWFKERQFDLFYT